jgi:hypothetical protein
VIQADIKLLPCNRIWYSPAHNKYYRGTVERLYKDGLADIRCESMELGDHVDMEEVKYGKETPKCWYFHNVSEATKNIMANLGRPLVDDEEYPAHFVKQKEAELEEEFVEQVVKNKLESLKESPNGTDSTVKHRKANSNI